MKNIPDLRNGKEHYKSFMIKENKKYVKQSEIITYQPSTFQNPDIADIKPIITEHPKTSNKLSKTKRQDEKVNYNGSLYKDTKKVRNFWIKQIRKTTKQKHAFTGYARTYNVEIVNSFNPNYNLMILNLQLKVS